MYFVHVGYSMKLIIGHRHI